MSPSLTGLSQELLLRVVDLLLKENESSKGTEDRSRDLETLGIDDDEDLNDDTVKGIEIGEKDDGTLSAGEQALINLSRTCTSFYNLLSPQLFQSIILHNTERSGKAVGYLCSTHHRANVKKVYFKGEAPGNAKENFHDTEGVFPLEVCAVLENLSRFPNLETLVVEFDFHLAVDDFDDHWDEIECNLMQEERMESMEEREKAEKEEGWRALMAKTFNAVSTNPTSVVKDFVVRICPLKANSAFETDQLNKWLGQLDAFTFEAEAFDIGDGWYTNTMSLVSLYIDNLDRYFLNALVNVTRLTIRGHENGPIGESGTFEAFVPLRPKIMPKLRQLELGAYFIQNDLIYFLDAHSDTLEVLILNHCFCCSMGYTSRREDDEPPFYYDGTWAAFFDEYASKKPAALQRVTMSPYNADISDCSGERKTKDLLIKSRAEGREHRVFPYAEVDDKYGMLFEREGDNAARVRHGKDQEAWEALMEVVRENCARVKNERLA